MDKLILKGLKFHGFHGVYDEEKQYGNQFIVDLESSLSLQKAGESDELDATLNYAHAYKIVAEIINGPSVNLIEKLAYQIGERIFSEFSLNSLNVHVRKLNPPIEGSSIEYSEVVMSWPR